MDETLQDIISATNGSLIQVVAMKFIEVEFKFPTADVNRLRSFNLISLS